MEYEPSEEIITACERGEALFKERKKCDRDRFLLRLSLRL